MLILTLVLGCVLSVLGGYIPPGPKYTCPKHVTYIYPCKCLRGTDLGIYVHCENTNLASLSIGLQNLGNEDIPIEELTISKCNISRLYGPALYPLLVRKLMFYDTPIKLIEEHSFMGINRTLQELYLENSVLEKFPKEAFRILGNLTILRIRGHQMEELPTDGFANSLLAPKLERLEISNGKLSSLPIETFSPLRKLKVLSLYGNQIKELKKNQFKGLRDVEALDLSHNLIEKLDSSHLGDLTKMGWCNMSDNAIQEFKRGTFARNSLLKVLNLNNNKIRKLDSNTLRGMRLMRRLYLSNNKINDVGRGTFGTVTRIGTIDLSKNMIKKIDFQMFHQLQFVEVIDVSENQVTVIEKLAFKDIYLATVNLSHNAISKIETGAFENCANISVLDLSYNKIVNISKKAFDHVSYATELQLSYNLMTLLNQVPLQNMTGLKVLNVSHNHIRAVPRQTFPKLYELHTIDLSYNNLTDIHNSVFQTLFGLRFLNMSHNSLERIKPSTFGPLPTLLDLDMSYNRLLDVSRGSMTRLSSCRTLSVKNNRLRKIFLLPISLGHLDMSDNNIEEIPNSDVWPSMNALLSLDLSRNRLGDSLQQGCFENLLTLRVLKLESNNITKPPWAALSSLNSLQYLHLENNNLTSLGKAAFGRLPIVFELNLANNQVQNISFRAFEGLLQLLTLNLTNNNITYIPNGAFSGLVSLQSLDLSHNFLEKLDNKTNGLLDDCLSLEKVNLSHNRISFITRKTFPNDPWIPYKLREIDLSYNTLPVLTFDFTVGAKKLEVLNISHNNINEIRRYVIGNMTKLQVLDLSHNDLSDLSEEGVFLPQKNVSRLFLNNNRFADLPWSKIVALPGLKELNLESNNFAGFNDNLMKILKNGTSLKYTNNPLHCDCYVRPLRRWFYTMTEVPDEWANMVCASPELVANQVFPQIGEESLTCSEREIVENSVYDVTPDVKYRNLEYDNEENTWKVTWQVASREDTGDFYLVVREAGGGEPIWSQDVVYRERSLVIRDLPETGSTKYELCVLARDSERNVKHFRNSQCRILDKHLFGGAGKSIHECSFHIVIGLVACVTYYEFW